MKINGETTDEFWERRKREIEKGTNDIMMLLGAWVVGAGIVVGTTIFITMQRGG